VQIAFGSRAHVPNSASLACDNFVTQKILLAGIENEEYLIQIMTFPKVHLLAIGIFTLTAGLALAQNAPQKPPTSPEGLTTDTSKNEAVDKVPGYGGIAFGAEFPVADFELEQDRGKLKIYQSKDEPPLLGPANLETILYYVFDGKLYGVAFHTDDGQDSLALKSVLVYAFGPGQDSEDGGPSTIWLGKKNGALFELNTFTGYGSAFIFDHKLHDACLADQTETAKAAAQKLIQGK